MVAQEEFVNRDAGEQRSEDYLKINPLGGVPTLMESGNPPITQWLATLEFLEETTPLPPLLPADRQGSYRVRSLCGMLASDIHPLITPRVRKYLGTSSSYDDAAWRAWQTHWFTTGLHAVEQRLAGESKTGLFLPRRPSHHGRCLPSQSTCGNACVEHQRVRHSNHFPHHGPMRRAVCVRASATASPDGCARVNASV
jgi:hypothetical protein